MKTQIQLPAFAVDADSRTHECASRSIPKRIIQTGKNSDHPLHIRAMVRNLKLLNPDFEYVFFDDEGVERFMDEEFPQYRTLFNAFEHKIQRYDFFRYLAVYRYGGFYFDTDVLLASGLSPLLDAECVFPFEGLTLSRFLRKNYGIDWEIGNYAFGASAGHPFLSAVIENCVKAQADPDWANPMLLGAPPLFRSEYRVLNTTGPGLLTRTLAENPGLRSKVTVLFPEDVCDENNWNQFGDLGVHFMEGSWRTKSTRIWRRLAQRWEHREMQKLLKESRKLGKTRHNA
jgi:inositol phosphorylceramide mannosyltransferase catalytic subunit